jgi:hypothetical protein
LDVFVGDAVNPQVGIAGTGLDRRTQSSVGKPVTGQIKEVGIYGASTHGFTR